MNSNDFYYFCNEILCKMDYLSIIRKPIEGEMNDFVELFNKCLSQGEGLLEQVLSHIRQRGGKRMRPMLILLTAKNYGVVSDVTQNAALGLELLHTASLVHDDVVDESSERRGQPSVNASYNNKVAVLVGDYILSTALLRVALSDNHRIVQHLAELGHKSLLRYDESESDFVEYQHDRTPDRLVGARYGQNPAATVAAGGLRHPLRPEEAASVVLHRRILQKDGQYPGLQRGCILFYDLA